MNTEEAKEFAKTMTYRDAIYNLKQARCVPYKKATLEVINRLVDELDNLENVKIGKWVDTERNEEYWGREFKCPYCGAKDIGEWDYCHNCGHRMEVTK